MAAHLVQPLEVFPGRARREPAVPLRSLAPGEHLAGDGAERLVIGKNRLQICALCNGADLEADPQGAAERGAQHMGMARVLIDEDLVDRVPAGCRDGIDPAQELRLPAVRQGRTGRRHLLSREPDRLGRQEWQNLRKIAKLVQPPQRLAVGCPLVAVEIAIDLPRGGEGQIARLDAIGAGNECKGLERGELHRVPVGALSDFPLG